MLSRPGMRQCHRRPEQLPIIQRRHPGPKIPRGHRLATIEIHPGQVPPRAGIPAIVLLQCLGLPADNAKNLLIRIDILPARVEDTGQDAHMDGLLATGCPVV